MTSQQLGSAQRGFAPGATALALAARALSFVLDDGCTAEVALIRADVPPQERAAVRAILSGTLRWYLRLAPVLDALLQRGQTMHAQVRAVLVTALHQIEYSRAAAESVANIAVDAVRVAGQPGASGFVNALLRRYLRERGAVLQGVDRSEPAMLAHPRWLLQAIREEHGTNASQIIQANNEMPPMTLRVNPARATRDAMLEKLASAGIIAYPGAADTALVLDQPMDVSALPGFSEGELSVQDAGAQYAAQLLDAQPGERVLDACAAPGGKSGHILERTADLGELVAVDIDAERLARVAANLQRLAVSATLLQADLLTDSWWDGKPFDRILLDAPCSGTGVIRRHPDIKLLRRPGDLDRFAATQRKMLRKCADMLKPGGRLLYATCSILAAENQMVTEEFLVLDPRFRRLQPDVAVLPTPRAAGPPTLTDGFHYACLQKGEA
ncbi:MAG: 16S rRNA (cytosine(967)-C(5))-methyltransferase RsmB [Pseudomonadota bacterium]